MKILAVDFGDARTGLACCDRTEYLASPIGVLHDKDFGSVLQKWPRPQRIRRTGESMWAMPINMNGTEGAARTALRRFCRAACKACDRAGAPLGRTRDHSVSDRLFECDEHARQKAQRGY